MPFSESYFVDNIEGMKKYPDGYFELAICDIEYGIGASKPTKKPNQVKQKNGTTLQIENPNYVHSDWDMKKSSRAYFDELFRVSQKQIVFGGNYYGLEGGFLVWDKLNGLTDQYGCELAWLSFTKRTDIVYYMWSGMMQGRYCGKDVKQALIQQGNKQLNEKRIHETQKPIKLYEWIIDNYANEGDKIIDTHLGSQSSRIAAYKKGFYFVGFENNENHFARGEKRFAEEIEKFKTETNLQNRQLSLLQDLLIFSNSDGEIENGFRTQEIVKSLKEIIS